MNPLKILIVDDEFISRTLLKEMLQQFGSCDIATDGQQALEMIQAADGRDVRRYDLVCLDIMLPGRNGHEVLKDIRRLEASRSWLGDSATKVLMVSALDDTQSITRAMLDGRCEGYMAKPITTRKLISHLRSLRLITAKKGEE